jgi:hypothetical protein
MKWHKVCTLGTFYVETSALVYADTINHDFKASMMPEPILASQENPILCERHTG